jgi:cytochrome b
MQSDVGTTQSSRRWVRAWDVPTRLCHWALVVLVGLAYLSRKWDTGSLTWHKWNGYAVLVLIVWRVLWGFVGSSTARFRSFVYGPWTAAVYGLDFVRRRPRRFLGHNPLGGMMAIVMLSLVGAMGVLGLMSYDDHTALAGGPLAGKVSDETWATATKWHIRLFDMLLIVIGLHVAANLVYLVWKRENLIGAMLSGRKPAADFEDEAEAQIATSGRAVVCLIAAVGIVFGGIVAFGGRVF